MFNEEQIFSLLRIIQNYENRRDIFKEGDHRLSDLGRVVRLHSVNAAEQHVGSQGMDDEESNDEYQTFANVANDAACEIDGRFDPDSWHEFQSDLSIKLADCFLSY